MERMRTRRGPLLLLALLSLLVAGAGTASGKDAKRSVPNASAGAVNSCVGRDKVVRIKARCSRGERRIQLSTPERGTRRAGDITAVTAGAGLEGGGTSGAVTLAVRSGYQLPQGCAVGQVAVARAGPSAWECALITDYRLPTLCARDQTLLYETVLFRCDYLGSGSLANGAVTTPKLADDTVTTVKIANDAVTGAKIEEPRRVPDSASCATEMVVYSLVDSWECDYIGPGSLMNGAVTTPKLADGSVSTVKIADSAVTGPKIEMPRRLPVCDTEMLALSLAGGTGWNCGPAMPPSCGSGQMLRWSPTRLLCANYLGNGDVTELSIADGAVSTRTIAGGAVTTPKLADESVVTPKIGPEAVTGAKLAPAVRLPVCAGPNASLAGWDPGVSGWWCVGLRALDCAGPPSQEVLTIDLSEIQCVPDGVVDGGVTTSKLADGSVVTLKVANGAVTRPKLALDVRPPACPSRGVPAWDASTSQWDCVPLTGTDCDTTQSLTFRIVSGVQCAATRDGRLPSGGCGSSEVLKGGSAGVFVCGEDLDHRLPESSSCNSSQILRWNGSEWTCTADENTTYSGASPIDVTGTTIGLSSSGCGAGEVWKFDGFGWSCDPDDDQDDRLPGTCPGGQVPKSNGPGAGFSCGNDDDHDDRLPTCTAGDTPKSNGPGYSCHEGLPDETSCDAGDVNGWSGTEWTCSGVTGANISLPLQITGSDATHTLLDVRNSTGSAIIGVASNDQPGASGVTGSGRIGVFGFGQTGIVGSSNGQPGSRAGHFSGNVDVDGTVLITGDLIVTGVKQFRIPHPLDPQRKWLAHAAVESPEMKNIYDGNVTTNAKGYAVVRLPAYFQALNRDYRYQLTVIGSFAQAIVWKEIAGNRFTIRTSKPHVKVSWQVTGIRHDAYARAHPMQVETSK